MHQTGRILGAALLCALACALAGNAAAQKRPGSVMWICPRIFPSSSSVAEMYDVSCREMIR